MSYQVQQAIVDSKETLIRGFRQDEANAALCSHLYTMVRGNRQHRRAFLISLLNLFDDNSVSVFFNVLHYVTMLITIFCSYSLCFSIAVSVLNGPCFLKNGVLFSSHAEVRCEHAAVCRRQSRLLPISESGRATVHHAPCRHHTISVRQQPAAVLQRGVLLFQPLTVMNFCPFTSIMYDRN